MTADPHIETIRSAIIGAQAWVPDRHVHKLIDAEEELRALAARLEAAERDLAETRADAETLRQENERLRNALAYHAITTDIEAALAAAQEPPDGVNAEPPAGWVKVWTDGTGRIVAQDFSRHPKHHCICCGSEHAPGSGCNECRWTGYDQTPCLTCRDAQEPPAKGDDR